MSTSINQVTSGQENQAQENKGQENQTRLNPTIQHPQEELSNAIRLEAAQYEPASLRTFTPSLAVIAKSEGCYHFTPEGRKLADFTSGVLVANLGHHPTKWWQRVYQAMQLPSQTELDESKKYQSGIPLTAYNALTSLEVEASKRLIESVQSQPGGSRCEQVLWAASGSEAIQKALWAALDRRENENIILATRFGFHGKKGLANSITGSEADDDRDERVRFISFPQQECIDVAAQQQPIDLTTYQQELDALWEELGSQICVLITEPYLGAAGSFHPQPEYLQLLQNFCREHDIVFILDEVQANFARTGEVYAFTKYGVEPDIVVLGKGLGNGVPVAAAVGRADLFSNMKFGEASDTWSANPLSCAAVLATLEEFESPSVMENAKKLGDVLQRGLLKLESELDIVKHVRGESGVWGIECAAIGNATASEVANACVKACYLGNAEGKAIHLLGALAKNVLRVSPPLTMPCDEAKEYMQVMLEIFTSVQASLTSN